LTEIQKSDCRDWPDDLAAALMQDPALSLSYWSKATGITPWSLSRGFEADEAKSDLEGDGNERAITADSKQ
jgi:hypothetical protein